MYLTRQTLKALNSEKLVGESRWSAKERSNPNRVRKRRECNNREVVDADESSTRR